MRVSNILYFLLLFLAIGYITAFDVEAKDRNRKPLVWDINSLMQIKTAAIHPKQFEEIVAKANDICRGELAVITSKTVTFAPDYHYYCSIGPYWWPDPLHPGNYINKDGQVNPESKNYDNVRLGELVNNCSYLSRAFFITNDIRYYNVFIRQLKAWFIEKETYMYPNFEYSQVVPGQNNNRGRSTGLITAYDFNSVIESIRLVNGVKRIDKKTMKALQKWFLDFAQWADNGSFGKTLHRIDNNISLAFDVMLVNMYLFAGKERRAKEIVDSFANKRINKQIKPDGSQPEELLRTNAFSYSLYNLTHIVDFCYLARYWYPDYYIRNRERIDAAMCFLGQYIENHDSFPYQQISGWKTNEENYNSLLSRINNLK